MLPQPRHNAKHDRAQGLPTDATLGLDPTASRPGGIVRANSSLVCLPIDYQLESLSRQASRVKSRSMRLLGHARRLSVALTMQQRGTQCPSTQIAKAVTA